MNEQLFQILTPETVAQILADFAQWPEDIGLIENLPEFAEMFWDDGDRRQFNQAFRNSRGYDWPDPLFDLGVSLAD